MNAKKKTVAEAKAHWFALDDLSSMKAYRGFQLAAEESRAVAMKETGASTARIELRCDSGARWAMSTLTELIAEGGTTAPAAARVLSRLVEDSVTLLNQLAFAYPKLLQPIGRNASCWPVLHSD